MFIKIIAPMPSAYKYPLLTILIAISASPTV